MDEAETGTFIGNDSMEEAKGAGSMMPINMVYGLRRDGSLCEFDNLDEGKELNTIKCKKVKISNGMGR